MPSTEVMLQYGLNLRNKVGYSMSNRLASNQMDCSSYVFRSLIHAGFLKQGSYIGNTETLFGLNGSLLTEIGEKEVRRGDIFVAGHQGASLGSAGHTGQHLKPLTSGKGEILHCTYSKGWGNIAVTQARGWMGDYSGLPVRHFRLKDTTVGGVTENTSQQRLLAVDGRWGNATTRRLQEVLACAIRDGIISGQIVQPCNKNIYSLQSGVGGSNVIRALQSLLGVEQDGYIGRKTITALQRRMGTLQDGEISSVSDCVKEMQRRLNENKI